MSGSNDPPGYRPPAKPPTDAIHRTDPAAPKRPVPSRPPAPAAAAKPAPLPPIGSAPPAPGAEPGKKPPKEIFAAPPPEPMSANTKLAIGAAGVFALYLIYWATTGFSAMNYKDRVGRIPVEAYGGTAQMIAEMVRDEGKRRGLSVRLDGVKVHVGADSALGRLVTIDVRYRRLMLPSKKFHVELRCPNPLQGGKWDGARYTEGEFPR
jgi:hypothetical protein